MAGLFNIIPAFGSTLTCSLGDVTGVDYYITSYDFVESAREEIIYDESGQNLVRGVRFPLAEAIFNILVVGDTEAEVGTNLRTLIGAFRNQKGGMIQFRPREYGSGVRSTYYHYVRSKPPTRLAVRAFNPDQPSPAGQHFEFRVMIQPWATSDPASPTTLKSATAISNRYVAGSVFNYVVIDNAGIVGDVAFPIITVRRTDANGSPLSGLIMNKRTLGPGGETHSEWWEAESMSGSGGSNSSVGYMSGGSGYSIGASASATRRMTFASRKLDSSYLGKTSVIIAGTATGVGVTGLVGSNLGVTGGGNEEASRAINLDATANDQIWFFSEFDLPAFQIPKWVTDSTSPGFDDVLDDGNVSVLITTDGSSSFIMDWAMMLKAEEWIAAMEIYVTSQEIPSSGGSSYALRIDAYSDSLIVYNTSTGAYAAVWGKIGMPLSDLVLYPSGDTVLNFIAYQNTPVSTDIMGLRTYVPTYTMEVTVTAIFGTIYPFSS